MERSATGAGVAVNVLLVEDDADLRDTLTDFLRLYGMEVTAVGSALDCYREMIAGQYALAILDLNLPDQDGTEIARVIAAKGRTGIIIITGRGGADTRLKGFEAGADLFFTKPVDPAELLAAARNLLRRMQTPEAVPEVVVPNPGDGGIWRIDRRDYCLVAPNGRSVAITWREFQLLELMAVAPKTVVPRQQLLDELGYAGFGPESRGLDALVSRLRRKVATGADLELPLHTMKAVGIVFSDDLVLSPDR